MEQFFKEIQEAMGLCKAVRNTTQNWSQAGFLAFIGTMADQRAADDGVDASELWEMLNKAAETVNAQLGPMEAMR